MSAFDCNVAQACCMVLLKCTMFAKQIKLQLILHCYQSNNLGFQATDYGSYNVYMVILPPPLQKHITASISVVH